MHTLGELLGNMCLQLVAENSYCTVFFYAATIEKRELSKKHLSVGVAYTLGIGEALRPQC